MDDDLSGDEENAYVFYMRFFNIMQEVTKTSKYQADKVTNDDVHATLPSSMGVQIFFVMTSIVVLIKMSFVFRNTMAV